MSFFFFFFFTFMFSIPMVFLFKMHFIDFLSTAAMFSASILAHLFGGINCEFNKESSQIFWDSKATRQAEANKMSHFWSLGCSLFCDGAATKQGMEHYNTVNISV